MMINGSHLDAVGGYCMRRFLSRGNKPKELFKGRLVEIQGFIMCMREEGGNDIEVMLEVMMSSVYKE